MIVSMHTQTPVTRRVEHRIGQRGKVAVGDMMVVQVDFALRRQTREACDMAKKYPALDLGWLPVDLINRTLGTELDPGRVRLSPRAHRHIAEDHPNDYATCIAALPHAIAAPTYVGQAPHHAGNIELVKRVRGVQGWMVLVAVGLEPDKRGDYRVRSAYLIREATVEGRRLRGRLLVPKW